MAQLKILILGAGVAGSAAAFWLSKLGHDVTVLERFPSLRVNGLQLDLRGYGIKVIRIMGLEAEIRSRLVPEEGAELVDSTGRRRAYFAANKSGKGPQSMTSEFEIMRSDLCYLLYDNAVRHGTKYVFGMTVESFEETADNGVAVKFTDGSTARYDLLIGADGQHSRIRRMLFGGFAEGTKDEALTPLANNQRMAYFKSRKPAKEGEQYVATGYLLPGNRAIMTRRHNQDQIQWYLKCEGATDLFKNVRRGDTKAEKEAFVELFQGSGWRADEVIKELKEGADDFYCAYLGVVKLDKWSRGHVMLLGDSAWCPSSNGYGTSTAIVGAYILAGEIATHYGRGRGTATATTTSSGPDALLTAVSQFEEKMRPFVAQIQHGVSTEPTLLDRVPSTWLTVSIINFLAGIAAFLRLDIVARYAFTAEDVTGWELPYYKDMVEN